MLFFLIYFYVVVTSSKVQIRDAMRSTTVVRLIFNLATRRKIFSGFLEHWNLMSNCTFGGISFIFFLLNGVESPHSILFYPVHRRYSVLSCAYSSDDVRKM